MDRIRSLDPNTVVWYGLQMTEESAQLVDAKQLLLYRIRDEIGDQRVLKAMELVPREEFLPEEIREQAYEDSPHSIGAGQTISQPFIVAMMVSALEIRQGNKILEIGAGSGYQAAVLAEIASEVISIERIDSLINSARARLDSLGYTNVRIESAGDSLGRSDDAPYDGIIVAAAAPKLPHELLDQLTVGGRLVIPVGDLHSQELMKVTKSAGSFGIKTLGACRFVPLIGKGAWPPDNIKL